MVYEYVYLPLRFMLIIVVLGCRRMSNSPVSNSLGNYKQVDLCKQFASLLDRMVRRMAVEIE